MQSRVVITGIGFVTPVGTGREQFWEGMLAGRCGVSAFVSATNEQIARQTDRPRDAGVIPRSIGAALDRRQGDVIDKYLQHMEL